MRFGQNLTDFNRRFAQAMRDILPDDLVAEQSADGALILRDDNRRSHVAVHLEADARGDLDFATPLQREVMILHLIRNLTTRVRAQYAPNKPAGFALSVVLTREML